MKKIALQLYTLREDLANDYIGTLKKIKKIGYEAVEFGGEIPYKGPELKKIINDLNLDAVGIHVGVDGLKKKLDYWIDFCETIGSQNIICPFIAIDLRKDQNAWFETAEFFNGVGKKCRKRNIRFAYHNHSFEFEKFAGKYALDLLYENTSEDFVAAELDTYWIKHGGENPAEYIKKYSGRISILHIKDMGDDAEKSFKEIGNGILDWPNIFIAAEEAGINCYCVEQDRCEGPAIESARISLEFCKSVLTG
jgi:sugar phosphate isomerase/epimerase